jgi:hypothetical protein
MDQRRDIIVKFDYSWKNLMMPKLNYIKTPSLPKPNRAKPNVAHIRKVELKHNQIHLKTSG